MALRIGFMDSLKDEILLDIDAIRYLPGEMVNTIKGEGAALKDIYDAVEDEVLLDINAFQFLPEEIGKSVKQIIKPAADEIKDPLASVKWIMLAGLGIYALTLAAPAIKKFVK